MTATRFVLLVVFVLSIGWIPSVSQEKKPDPKKTPKDEYKVKVTPSSLKLSVGESAELKAKVLDADGKEVKATTIFLSLARRSVAVGSRSGQVKALRPGKFKIVVMVAGLQNKKLRVTVPVEVKALPIQKVQFVDPPQRIYQSTTLPVRAKAFNVKNLHAPKAKIEFASSNPKIAEFDDFNYLTAHQPGKVTLSAKAEDVVSKLEVEVVPNPVRRLELSADQPQARTGDVLHFKATAKDQDGNVLADAPITFSFFAKPDDNLGPPASGQIEQDGRFVAEKPGAYTIVATCGNYTARMTVKITQRDVKKKVQLVGHVTVGHVHTSDLWVWEGVDGRDYCVTGTWGGKGEAYFWDVTDPKNMKKIFTVKVDARTVNDVKVSEDGRICVISREGASNRKNGIVILDVTNPHEVKTLSTFDDQLTGGVHNVFIYKDHVYAVNNSRRYDVINIKDPTKPKRVARFELTEPGHSLHDVWIVDGIAYSSNWRHGVVLVDVGNGIAGGSPENPVKISSYAYPSGWNHAAFPFKSSSTGKFYVIAGDETFPEGLNVTNRPTIPGGWIHFIDFTDIKNPKEVARYEVPEAGTHNMWVEDETLYVAYYNAGLRVVDISGELMGDLYRQGREIAVYRPYDKKGIVPNAPMTWGPQPHKGVIFMSDWNSGLWAVRLVETKRKKR